MKRCKTYLIILISGITLLQGIAIRAQEKTQSHESTDNSNYVSIAGLWRCSPETVLKLETITLEATIFIRQKIPSDWNVQGCFMCENRFCDYWSLSGFQFVDSTGQVTFKDNDGSIFVGEFDEVRQRINGMVYTTKGDSLVPEDKLDFMRFNDVSPERLFLPRKPEQDGSIKYSYKIPAEVEGMQHESIYNYINDSVAFTNVMKKIINQEFGRLESFLIVKDGKLILEEYFFDYDQHQLHNVFSCTKSIVSLLTGIAFNENNIYDMNRSLFNLLLQFDDLKSEEKEKISLKHVLTMSSGLERIDVQKFETVNALLEKTLSQPLESEPGKKFSYHWNSPNILGGVIFSLTGKKVNEYAIEKLFEPLGIEHYKWGREFGVPDCHSNLHLLPRDMAKIGQLVLNKGNWQGKQVVPEDWITESTQWYIHESDFLDYGYQWWHRSKENKAWWEKSRQEEQNMAFAMGYGGQYIFIIRDLGLCVVITSSDYNEGNGMALKKIPMVIKHVVPLFE